LPADTSATIRRAARVDFCATREVRLVIAGASAVIAIYAATLSIARNRTDAAREFS
jgi:hypothetical protein